MDKAMSHNMPKDNIERAIKRGAGGLDGEVLEELTYEGYGTNGVALLVKCVTDNRNRTVASVRHAFNKCGGSLGTDGSVAYLFSQQGQITFPPESDEEKIMEAALEAGAEDVAVNSDNSIDVITAPENFETTKKAMQAARLEPVHAEITMASAVKITLDKDNSEKLLKMIEMLEDLDDVQEVFSNADISEETLQDVE